MDGAKLSGFDLHRYELPFCEPLMLKGAALHNREGLLLELAGEDCAVGWGETSPLPGFSPECLDEAAGQLRGLASSMVGRAVTDDRVDPDGDFNRELAATVPVNALISSPDTAIEEASRARSAGYEAVRLKIGGKSVVENLPAPRADVRAGTRREIESRLLSPVGNVGL